MPIPSYDIKNRKPIIKAKQKEKKVLMIIIIKK